ncbi:hypothetical protein AYI69_g10507, partial [Smittium culicis]
LVQMTQLQKLAQTPISSMNARSIPMLIQSLHQQQMHVQKLVLATAAANNSTPQLKSTFLSPTSRSDGDPGFNLTTSLEKNNQTLANNTLSNHRSDSNTSSFNPNNSNSQGGALNINRNTSAGIQASNNESNSINLYSSLQASSGGVSQTSPNNTFSNQQIQQLMAQQQYIHNSITNGSPKAPSANNKAQNLTSQTDFNASGFIKEKSMLSNSDILPRGATDNDPNENSERGFNTELINKSVPSTPLNIGNKPATAQFSDNNNLSQSNFGSVEFGNSPKPFINLNNTQIHHKINSPASSALSKNISFLHSNSPRSKPGTPGNFLSSPNKRDFSQLELSSGQMNSKQTLSHMENNSNSNTNVDGFSKSQANTPITSNMSQTPVSNTTINKISGASISGPSLLSANSLSNPNSSQIGNIFSNLTPIQLAQMSMQHKQSQVLNQQNNKNQALQSNPALQSQLQSLQQPSLQSTQMLQQHLQNSMQNKHNLQGIQTPGTPSLGPNQTPQLQNALLQKKKMDLIYQQQAQILLQNQKANQQISSNVIQQPSQHQSYQPQKVDFVPQRPADTIKHLTPQQIASLISLQQSSELNSPLPGFGKSQPLKQNNFQITPNDFTNVNSNFLATNPSIFLASQMSNESGSVHQSMGNSTPMQVSSTPLNVPQTSSLVSKNMDSSNSLLRTNSSANLNSNNSMSANAPNFGMANNPVMLNPADKSLSDFNNPQGSAGNGMR